MKNIKDKEFIRGNIPMTKFNIRNLAAAYLQIEKDDKLLDIGGGTGSVSVECALQGASVTTIEMKKEACSLIKANAKKFGTEINLIEGKAPEDLPCALFDKCFIGGSAGKLKDIFSYLKDNLKDGGILCGTFIIPKNLNEFLNLLKEFKYTDIEVHLIQTAEMNDIGLFKGENPIYIVKAQSLKKTQD